MEESAEIYLENNEINYMIVIFLPLGMFLFFLASLLFALVKSEEPSGNILRIIFYIIAQFLLIPFLVLFILINTISLSISVVFCDEAKYISVKKIKSFFEYFKCNCEKKIEVIKIEKKIENVPNKKNDMPKVKKLNKENKENLNEDKEKEKNSIEISEKNFVENKEKNEKLNNNKEEIKEEKKEVEIKDEKKENLQNEFWNKKENQLEQINIMDKNILHNNSNKNLNLKNENKQDDSKEELKQKKVNIFLDVNKNDENNNAQRNYNFNKPPAKRKVDKGKIMNFLGEVLVNKDNTPSYINLFHTIKQKSKERLEKQNKSNNIISPFK